MRQDSGVDGDAQRISQLVWLIFLKLFDAAEELYEWDEDDEQHFILLLSHKPIDQLQNDLDLIRYQKGNPMTRLKNVFQERILDLSAIRYEVETLEFRGTTVDVEGIILALVFSLE